VVDAENNASLLYPNKYLPASKKLKAGELFSYPGSGKDATELTVRGGLGLRRGKIRWSSCTSF